MNTTVFFIIFISLFNHESAPVVDKRGFISPAADNVYMKLAIDSLEVAHGELTSYYGDYEIEEGVAVATHNDDKWINIKEVVWHEIVFYAKGEDLGNSMPRSSPFYFDYFS